MKKIIGVISSIILIVCLTVVISYYSDWSVEAADEIVQELTFSKESGYYNAAFSLSITAEEGSTIYYTTDGNEPEPGKTGTTKYTAPISVKNIKGNSAILATSKNSSKFVEGSAYTPSASDLDRAFVVRALAVKSDGTKTPVSTRTYFVGNDIKEKYDGCAVMSIVVDPDYLLSDEDGIYVLGNNYDETGDIEDANFMQKGKSWERAAYMEFFNGENTADISQGVGIRIHGGYSRRNQQKSLNIYFREDYDYGTKNLSGYQLIEGATKTFNEPKKEEIPDEIPTEVPAEVPTEVPTEVPAESTTETTSEELTQAPTEEPVKMTTTKYKNVMLRNGGNDVDISKFQDVFIQKMVEGKNFTTQSSQPCMLYLNGEYWGLYNLTEKYSDKYLEEEFDVDNNNVIMYKNFEIDEGEDLDPDGKALEEYMALGELDMTKEANYQKFLDMVDIDSFIDYYATEIYICNNDWWSGCNDETPRNNIQFWKVADPEKESATNPYADGKWRYMLFDTEWSMGIYNSNEAKASYDSIKYHALGLDNDNGDPLFTALFKNDEFVAQFTNTILDIRNWNFEYNRALKTLRELRTLYTPLMEEHYIRWRTGNVNNGYNNMKTFINERPNYILQFLEDNISNLKSSDRVNVTVSSNIHGADYVKVNTITPDITGCWENAIYYKDYPITVTARDIEGYEFLNWKVTGGTVEDINAQSTTITLNASSANIQAVYKDGEGNIPVPTATPKPTATPTPTPKPTNRPGWGGGNWWGDNKTPTPAPKQTATPKPVQITDAPTFTPNVVVEPTNKPIEQPVQSTPSVTERPPYIDDTTGTIFEEVGNATYIIEGNDAVYYAPSKKNITKVTIPATIKVDGKTYKVVSIKGNAFKGCKKLTTVTIGKNVKSIESKAFYGCKKLKKITVKSKVLTVVGKSAFKGIANKAVIKVPATKITKYKKIFKNKGQKSTVIIKK